MNSIDGVPNTYQPGHPWFYPMGGRALFPSEIKASVDINTYSTLMVEGILKASAMTEPIRSESLRAIRAKIRQSLKRDLDIYLDKYRELKARRLDPKPPDQPISLCVYTAMSLKHSYIYNDDTQLMTCEHHLSMQTDLFAF